MKPIFYKLTFIVSLLTSAAQAAPVELSDELPKTVTRIDSTTWLLDYGRVALGNLRIEPTESSQDSVTIHFGEAFANGRIDRNPPGSVRYAVVDTPLDHSISQVIAPTPDKRNTTHLKAVRLPQEWGVILPFRWIEIEAYSGELNPKAFVRQSAFPSTWDDQAADFECSDPMLNRIWELCRYSIKATSFAGVYVDGDRERIPYEADAYLNQLSGYYTDNDIEMARDTFDLLMKQPTWPTEWAPHMIFIAKADWMHTGDLDWLTPRYESLKTKLLLERVGEDGLITSNKRQIKRDDIVDWPPVERDGFVFTKLNSVVNAFHLKALSDMTELAVACGKVDEAQHYHQIYKSTKNAYQKTFFNPKTGLYVDGVGTEHSSFHANVFPLAFDLVPEANKRSIIEWIQSRGMACSVYAAQYLMEALFENGADDYAVELMLTDTDRSWRHMVESGTTITWEAWDQKYKPNQDWNHAWGAAPANILPRYVLGVQSMAPNWETVQIHPRIANLNHAKGKVPTPHGPILIEWDREPQFSMTIHLPKKMNTVVRVPRLSDTKAIYINGEPVTSRLERDYFHLEPKLLELTTFVEVR